MKTLSYEEFIAIVAKEACIKTIEIRPDSKLTEDLGINSIILVNIILDIERWVGVEAEDLDFESIVTVMESYEYFLGVLNRSC